MEILKTMVEAVGKIVTINGKFVVIDRPPEDDGRQFANAVFVFEEKDKNLREKEIHTAVRIFSSGGGGNYRIEGRHFSFTHLWMHDSHRDKVIQDHTFTKTIVIYDEKSNQFFLVMDENCSLKEARNFIHEANIEGREKKFHPLQYKIGEKIFYKSLRLPHDTGMGDLRVTGSPHFTIFIHCKIVVIKLQLY